MATKELQARFPGHYGLEFALANSVATIKEVVAMLAKPNRRAKEDRKVIITTKDKEHLQRQLEVRTKERRRRENGRRSIYLK